jgi:hypothetical protein
MESLVIAGYLAMMGLMVNAANLPPGPEDPAFATVANEDAIFHMSWPGAGKVDLNSTNKTERLLGDEEVRTFLDGIRRRISPDGLSKTFPDVEAPVPQIVRLVQIVMTHPVTAFVNDVEIHVAKVGEDAKEPDAKEPDAKEPDANVKLEQAVLGGRVELVPAIAQEALQWELAKASLGLIVNAEEEADDLVKAILELRDVDPSFEVERVTGRPAGDGLILLAKQNGIEVYLGRKDTYLFAAMGEEALDAITDALNGRRETPTWYDEMSAQLDIPRPTKRVFVNIERIREIAEKALPPEANEYIKSLALDHVRRFAASSGLDETAFTSRMYLELDGPGENLLGIFPNKGLTHDDLALVPADATFAIAGQLDFGKFFDQVTKLTEDALGVNKGPAPNAVNDFRCGERFLRRNLKSQKINNKQIFV